MAERKSLSKKIRFEVFKRDSFTCQYCGSKAPDVILEVDHIKPVSKGGDNSILNLITSCQTCNRGKSDRKIDDNSIVERQRRQIEELNIRRQQLEMMLEWREELTTMKEKSYRTAINYFNNKWNEFQLNEVGNGKIKAHVDKFGLMQVLDAIDIACNQYKTNNEDRSFEVVLDKIGGILTIKNKPAVFQKIVHIKGICNKMFRGFDPAIASIILNNYVKALKSKGYNDDEILKDLDEEVMPYTKAARNYNQWQDMMNKWINDIKNWE